MVQEMKEECGSLNVEDYRLFAMALTQRYISPLKEELSTDFLSAFMDKQGPKKFSRRAFNALPEPEKEKLRDAIRDFHDRMLDVFQKVPAKLMLVMRNLNTIRAVIKVPVLYIFVSSFSAFSGYSLLSLPFYYNGVSVVTQ